MSRDYRDITHTLPLKPGCTAVVWRDSVALYLPNKDLMANIGLKPGEVPTAEWLVRAMGMVSWARVSDWRPA
jgi:hypothetical protein